MSYLQKRLLCAVIAGIQSPITYFLSGHSLFTREPGLGWMWYMMMLFAVFGYLFPIMFFDEDKK